MPPAAVVALRPSAVAGAVQARPRRLFSARFQQKGSQPNEEKTYSFNLNLVSELEPLRRGAASDGGMAGRRDEGARLSRGGQGDWQGSPATGSL